MKTQKLIYVFFCMSLFMATITNFTACGKNSANENAVPPAGTCAAGQVNTQFGCLTTTNCGSTQIGYGYYPTTNTCYPPVQVTGTMLAGGQPGQWTGALTAINQSVFGQLLQSAGACNRYNIINLWGENCKSYTPNGYIRLIYQGASNVTVQIMAGASNPAYIGLMNIAAGGGTYGGYGNGTITISRSMTITAVGSGFKLTDSFSGYYGGSGLSVSSTNESLNSINMNLTIQYAGQSLANSLVLK